MPAGNNKAKVPVTVAQVRPYLPGKPEHAFNIGIIIHGAGKEQCQLVWLSGADGCVKEIKINAIGDDVRMIGLGIVSAKNIFFRFRNNHKMIKGCADAAFKSAKQPGLLPVDPGKGKVAPVGIFLPLDRIHIAKIHDEPGTPADFRFCSRELSWYHAGDSALEKIFSAGPGKAENRVDGFLFQDPVNMLL